MDMDTMTDEDVTMFTDILKRMHHMDLFMRDGMYLLQTHTTAKAKFYSAYEDLETAIQLKQRSMAAKAADTLDAFVEQLSDDVEKLESRIAYSSST
jgi:hypothetical protein